jgi:5,6-dimethylbenzimidazole synthase
MVPVHGYYDEPMLHRERWAQRSPLSSMVFDDRWGRPSALFDAPQVGTCNSD